jgi:hypothetical protein
VFRPGAIPCNSKRTSRAMPAGAEEFEEQQFGVFRQSKAEGVRL